jgi:hypothetical protein
LWAQLVAVEYGGFVELRIFCLSLLLVLVVCQTLSAQNDFLADDATGTLIGLGYLSQSETDGYWLTSGYSTNGKFNIGGNFGRMYFAPGEKAWIFEPELSYIILKPLAPWLGFGSKVTIAARFYLLESEQLQRYNLQAFDRSYKLSSSVFYNKELSAKFILQPELFAGISFRILKIWDIYGNSLSQHKRDPIIGLGLSSYLTFSDTRILQLSTTVERVGKTTSYIFSLSFINEWVGIY